MDQKLKLKVFPGTVLYCMYIIHILHGSETEAEGVSGYSTVYISFLEANYLILLHFFQPVYRFYIYQMFFNSTVYSGILVLVGLPKLLTTILSYSYTVDAKKPTVNSSEIIAERNETENVSLFSFTSLERKRKCFI